MIDTADMKSTLGALARASAKLRQELNEAKEANRISEGEPRRVSDHAIVRYLERILEMDVEYMRVRINRMADEAEPFAHIDDALWHEASGTVLIIETGSVVTLLSREQAEKYMGRKLANGERAGPPALAPGDQRMSAPEKVDE